MRKPIFALIALAISLFGTECWAQESACGSNEGGGVSCTFSPTSTTNTYNFGNDGTLIVKFDTVLTTFTLTATVNHTIDPIDFTVFPEGTVCVPYAFNGSRCDQYDFTGNKSGPNGVPVKNIDYKRLITLTLVYLTRQSIHSPAFGHAPGDNATAVYSEDILTSYSSAPPCPLEFCDPTMDGTTPGLSSVVALDEPGGTDTFCFVSPTPGQTFSVGQEIEVTFQLSADGSGTCPIAGTPIRDKTARLSLAMTDCQEHFLSFPRLRNKEEGNKFHWDNKDGVNEFDLSTHRLAPGCYTITVFSSKFSPPQSVDINLIPGTDTDDPD
jgi:hypothetical protein